MQIQLYADETFTIPAGYINFADIGELTRTGGNPSTNTIGSLTYSRITGAVKFSDITGKPDKLFSQYSSDVNIVRYIKPNLRLTVKCGRREVVDPEWSGAQNDYRYQILLETQNEEWITLGMSGASNACVNAQYNIYTSSFISGGIKYCAMYYYTTGGSVHGFFLSENVFDESPREPTKSETGTVTPDGHYGTGITTKGSMTFVNYAGALSRVNTGTHGLRMYDVGEGAVNALYERLWSQDIWDKWANRKFSPIGGILSLHRVPLAAPTAGTVSSVTIAGQQYPVGSAALVSDNIAIRDFAAVEIPEIAGSFLDYAPYCSAMLYLPFIGSVGIDVNTISSGSIAVRYTFDLISGNCIAQVRTVDRDGSAIIYGTYAGNAAYKYPISGNDNGGFAVLGAAAGIATAGLAVAATGGSAAPLAASIVSGAASSISAEHHLQQAGSLPANTAALGDLRIYLVITRPAYLTPDGYEDIKGYPAGDGHTVRSYTGLLSGELHADEIPSATDWEKKEIERLFAEGVIL